MADHAPALRDRMPDALRDLARALDEVDRRADGRWLGDRRDLAGIRRGLVTALMQIVVLAHASSRGLADGDPVGAVHAGLRRGVGGSAWERLRAANEAFFEQTRAALFQPGTYPFLAAPIPDAAVLGLLDRLLGKEGARPDTEVEDIAGAYEGVLGFDLRIASGPTLIVLPQHVGVDLAALLAVPPAERAAWIAETAAVKPGDRLASALHKAGSIDALIDALARRISPASPDPIPAGALYVEPGEARRRSGAHYTPRAITRPLVERTLAPILDRLIQRNSTSDILDLAVADPAMGTGAFLVEACRQLAAALERLDPSLDPRAARRSVARGCLYGVDADPIAVALAEVALWLVVGDRAVRIDVASARLAVGDALVGSGGARGPDRASSEALTERLGITPVHWDEAFPEVFNEARRGFDAIVGNPPWVAYAGRAAQPLDEARYAFYLRHYPSFRGYRTLHGLFIERAAWLLAPGGRLGLVVPTSVSDLGGYAPTRRAHDVPCAIDDDLPDFGDAFEGVFQPSMGLLSTRREAPLDVVSEGAPWPVERQIHPLAQRLLARLSALPPLPAACFGERGLQTSGGDVKEKLRASARPIPPFVVPIREGTDVRAFHALPPRLHLDPRGLSGRLRAPEAWREVAVLVRQTARFPIAARADGVAFRNSILAGFAAPPFTADALLAWLNAAPIRWLHFMRHRDARQGMPQVKIAHLRTIPAIPADHLDRIAAHGRRDAGITPDAQRALDDAAADALGLTESERSLVIAWMETMPVP